MSFPRVEKMDQLKGHHRSELLPSHYQPLPKRVPRSMSFHQISDQQPLQPVRTLSIRPKPHLHPLVQYQRVQNEEPQLLRLRSQHCRVRPQLLVSQQDNQLRSEGFHLCFRNQP